MAATCVCQLCNCGRHRCPHNRGTLGKDPVKAKCELSEYKQKFAGYTYQPPRASLAPVINPAVSSEPIQGETTYNRTFITKKPNKVEATKPVYRLPSGNHDFGSTYQKEYPVKSTSRPEPIRRPNQYVLPSSRFVGDTHYNNTYQGSNYGRPEIVHHDNNLEIPEGKLDGTTTMKNDYQGYDKYTRVPKVKPPTDTHERWNTGDLGSTSYKDDFYHKEILPNTATARVAWEPPSKPFHKQSTYRNTYKSHSNYRKSPAYRPIDTYKPPKSPFMDRTTTNDTYKPWEVVPRTKPAWGEYQRHTPKGPFEHQTNYKEKYLGEPTDRVKPASTRAAATMDLSHGPRRFAANTEYNDRYKHHQDGSRRIPKPQPNELNVPSEPMNFMTTYKDDFIGKQIDRPKAINSALQRTIGETNWGHPTSYDTTYADTYQGKQDKCPVKGVVPTTGTIKLLKTNTSKHTFTHEKDGHFFFIPSPYALPPSSMSPKDIEATRAAMLSKVTKKAPASKPAENSTMNSSTGISSSSSGRQNKDDPRSEVQFNTPRTKLRFDNQSFEKRESSTSSTYRRPATPLPSSKTFQDFQGDFIGDETAYDREGMNQYGSYFGNFDSTYYDDVPSTWGNHNNNNIAYKKVCTENNNNFLDPHRNAYQEHLVQVIDFEKVLQVTSTIPDAEETWTLSP